MLYLLDADTLIRADSTYYPSSGFPFSGIGSIFMRAQGP